jgi:hypothetical protein
LGFDGVVPEETGRPSYHPAVLLKLYIYGYRYGAIGPPPVRVARSRTVAPQGHSAGLCAGSTRRCWRRCSEGSI